MHQIKTYVGILGTSVGGNLGRVGSLNVSFNLWKLG